MIGVNVPGGYLVSGCDQGVRSALGPSYQFRPNAKICSTTLYIKLDLSYVRDKLKEWVKKKGSTGVDARSLLRFVQADCLCYHL